MNREENRRHAASENGVSRMPSVRSSTRLGTDGHTSEMQKIVRCSLGSWRVGCSRATSPVCQPDSKCRATKPSWFLRKCTGLQAKGRAILGLPLPQNWCCCSCAFRNACYCLRCCLAVPKESTSLLLASGAGAGSLRQCTACRANSKLQLFSTWLHCPFWWFCWPHCQQPLFSLLPHLKCSSQPPLLTSKCIMRLKLSAWGLDFPLCCVANIGVAVQFGRRIVFKAAVHFLFNSNFAAS